MELLIVGWIDFKTRKISNKWIFFNAGLAVLLHFLVKDLYPFSWEILIIPAAFIFIGFFLYLINVMGAGDSKFLASLFLVIPPEFHLMFFEKLVLSTVITGATLLMLQILRNGSTLKAYFISRYWAGIKDAIRSRFSYAPVIVVAWILLGFNLWK